MTKEQIEKLCKVGTRKKLSAVELSRYVMQPPYNLSAAEATEVYFAFKNRYNAGTISKPVTAYPAKKIVTVKVERDCVEVMFAGGGGGGVSGSPSVAPSKLNRTCVKGYALAVSEQKRGGKFRRVSKSFLKQVEAELENVIRGIGGLADNDDISGDWDFIVRTQAMTKVIEQLNRAVRRIILRKVRSHPSIGRTLK